jgi:hypothetical protein
LRRFGITEGNRQTLSLGMTLDQLVNPDKYQAFTELWESQAPPGERLQEYAEKEWNHQAHAGETPPQIISEVLDYSQRAVTEADAAAAQVTTNQDEFGRLRNDIHCIRAMSEFYAAKANAALLVLRYNHSQDIADMEHAQAELAKSLQAYRDLAKLTEGTYQFANGMQTSQRKIPFSGGYKGHGTNYHWMQLVGIYERELTDFEAKVAKLKQSAASASSVDDTGIVALTGANFKLISTNAETYTVQPGAKVFIDRSFAIRNLALELQGLTGIRISHNAAKKGRYVPIEFEVSEPVQVLVGYVNGPPGEWLQVPKLETAAQADERGGIETVIANCATIEAMPTVNVHVFNYAAGRQKLEFIGKGSFVVLGIVPQSVKINPRDAGRRPGE